MRFSAIAVSAAVFGVAMAVPASIVYETEVVTITSCAPEKTNCPGRTQTSPVAVATPVVVPVAPSSAAVVIIPSATPSAVAPSAAPPSAVASSAAAPSSAAPSVIVIRPISSAPAPSAVPHSYPNGTASAVPHPIVVSTLQYVPSASAGLPSAPGNTSVPIVPTTPSLTPVSGASANGLSFAAAAIAAAAFIFA